MRSVVLKALTFVLFAQVAHSAQTETRLEQVGSHYPLLNFKKSENSQNVLIAYTKLSESCSFEKLEDEPLIDFYWLMDGSRFKKTHPLIKRNIRNRLEAFNVNERADSFALRLTGSDKEREKLKDVQIEVTSKKKGERCEIETIAHLSKDSSVEPIRLQAIQSETKRTFLPPFHKVKSITFVGEGIRTRQMVSQQFKTD